MFAVRRNGSIPATLLAVAAGLLFPSFALSADSCEPRNYLEVDLPGTRDPVRSAIELAYPDVRFSDDGKQLSFDGDHWLDMGTVDGRPPAEVLANSSIAEQFTYPYPIDFTLKPREKAFVDPGRLRNDAFFRALYFSNAEDASNSTTVIEEPRLANARFMVTTKRDVDCQLRAALDEIASGGEEYVRFFENPAGGFNWRTISGTDRLSSHSFGAAIDINAELGKYWKWTGAKEGEVGAYDNVVPEEIVEAMERYGFIWGGKWNHFDGMHFGYRPEMILHGRMVDDAG